MVLMFERAISKVYSVEKDEVEILDGDKSLGVESVAADSLSVEHRELASRIVRQHTSYKAFKQIYNEKVKELREEIKVMDESVLPVLQSSDRPIVVQSSEFTITLQKPASPTPGTAPSPPTTTTRSLPKAKSQELLREAIARALRDMRVDPECPYNPRLALQIMGHVQFRPLVRQYYADKLAEWRTADRDGLRETAGAEAGGGGGEAGLRETAGAGNSASASKPKPARVVSKVVVRKS
jgi:hypothetical protein